VGEHRPRRGALIVAAGNLSRGDDGAAPKAALGLRELGFSVLIVRELTPELAEEVAAASAVVFLDARDASPPGLVLAERLAPDGAKNLTPSLSHALAPEVVLALAAALYGARPPAFLVTVNGQDFGPKEELSQVVETALPVLRARAMELLDDPDLS
jgi:hydrogenase maturation protease